MADQVRPIHFETVAEAEPVALGETGQVADGGQVGGDGPGTRGTPGPGTPEAPRRDRDLPFGGGASTSGGCLTATPSFPWKSLKKSSCWRTLPQSPMESP
jgi:hypothetical protein